MKNNSWIVLGLIAVVGYLYYRIESARAVDGINSYFSNSGLIVQSTILYIILSGLLIGYVIAKLMGNKR